MNSYFLIMSNTLKVNIERMVFFNFFVFQHKFQFNIHLIMYSRIDLYKMSEFL